MRIESGLADGQVLQRRGNRGACAISGTCSAGGPVSATLRSGARALRGWQARTIGSAAGGRFSAALAGVPSGGPYRLELRVGREACIIAAFWVGDVWLLGGQSNMEGWGLLAQACPPRPGVRLLGMDGVWRQAVEPLHLLSTSPDSCHSPRQEPYAAALRTRRRLGTGTGPGLACAAELLARTRVPQGLIACAHGGTTMTQWDPAKKDSGGDCLYGSLLRSWRSTGQAVAGLLWYQGESDGNADAAPRYGERMRGFIAALRADLGQPRLPVVLVQLGRHTGGDPALGPHWESIREQQRLLPRQVRGVAMVPAIDLPLDDTIHIGGDGCQELGRRMAAQALRLLRGQAPETGPVPAAVRFEPARHGFAVLSVRFRGGRLEAGTLPPSGFALVTRDGRRNPAFYRIEARPDRVLLHCHTGMTDGAVAVVHGPGLDPICVLRDAAGGPVPAFGPLTIGNLRALTPFLDEALASEIQPAVASIAHLPIPARGALPAHPLRSGANGVQGMMNEHPRWEGRSGWAAIHFAIDCAEAMDLRLLFGYDGPFRLAIDGTEVFRDLAGTNPAIADQHRQRVALAAGRHEACVLMDLNGGLAWGFWFRIQRLDVANAAVAAGRAPMPRLGA